MLRYVFRVRDLVHGTILFTEQERRIIDHPYFQRLRQIRQNDVAFYVYPSLNTSRFEHVLGTCRVAGMMAESLTQCPKWRAYFRELKAQTGITSKEEFVELVRIYALLHDIGHPPLSHLFETAVEGYERARRPEAEVERFAEEWTGVRGFKKLHEAFGAAIAKWMVPQLELARPMQKALTRLMTEKELPERDPLSVIKSIVTSEIDADRTDFVQRDGFLAGGEYGHYDIRRLCDSVFIEEDERGWLIAYSEKALTSMEALLLDRYRVYVWIHFHHRVVATKVLVRFLIQKALERGIIRKDHFNPAKVDAFALHDDPWLWSILRDMKAGSETTTMIQRAVFYREKQNVLNLWKTMPAYNVLQKMVEDAARVTGFRIEKPESYGTHLSSHLGVQALLYEVPFEPVSKEKIQIYSEVKRGLTGKNLVEVSRLVANLDVIWKDEPQRFIILVGKNARARIPQLTKRWIRLTADWIRAPRLL